MNLLFFMIAISILLAFGFLLAFIWAVNRKQFDDLSSPALRMLFDDKKINECQEEKNVNNK